MQQKSTETDNDNCLEQAHVHQEYFEKRCFWSGCTVRFDDLIRP